MQDDPDLAVIGSAGLGHNGHTLGVAAGRGIETCRKRCAGNGRLDAAVTERAREMRPLSPKLVSFQLPDTLPPRSTTLLSALKR